MENCSKIVKMTILMDSGGFPEIYPTNIKNAKKIPFRMDLGPGQKAMAAWHSTQSLGSSPNHRALHPTLGLST